jgi:hypothetical protein
VGAAWSLKMELETIASRMNDLDGRLRALDSIVLSMWQEVSNNQRVRLQQRFEKDAALQRDIMVNSETPEEVLESYDAVVAHFKVILRGYL